MAILTLSMLIKMLFLEKVESDVICTEILTKTDKTLFERMFMELQSFPSAAPIWEKRHLKHTQFYL